VKDNNRIKQERDDYDNMNYNEAGNKSDWHVLRENVIKIFFEVIKRQFLVDIKKGLRQKAEAYVINK
jgi:hypothetical protein